MNAPEEEKLEHLDYQRRYFDQHCDFFRQPIPPEIEERTRNIVKSAKLSKDSYVLDVGTGMGVLIKHFLEEGVLEENITGCDLSANMLAEAKSRYPKANFWQGDFADFPVEALHDFDAAFFNACFGNIYDQRHAVEVASAALAPGGRLIISHPLGNEFVEKLRQHDKTLVLTLLPDRHRLEELSNNCGLAIETLIDQPDFYLAIMCKQTI